MWTDSFAGLGKRTTGTAAGNFAVVGPGWRGDLPEGLQRINSPTPFVWVIGRTRTDGPQDYAAVHKVQDGYKMTPLSQWNKEPQAITVHIDPSVDMHTPPVEQVKKMTPDAYFAYAAELLKENGPHLVDQPQLARMKRLGIEAGRSFDVAKVEGATDFYLRMSRPSGIFRQMNFLQAAKISGRTVTILPVICLYRTVRSTGFPPRTRSRWLLFRCRKQQKQPAAMPLPLTLARLVATGPVPACRHPSALPHAGEGGTPVSTRGWGPTGRGVWGRGRRARRRRRG